MPPPTSSMQQGQPASPVPDQLCFEVNIGVEILEDDGKGKAVTYNSVSTHLVIPVSSLHVLYMYM